jgi:hypothetical protein
MGKRVNIDQTLDNLIHYLLDEEKPDAPRDIPNNRAGKWRLFRAATPPVFTCY